MREVRAVRVFAHALNASEIHANDNQSEEGTSCRVLKEAKRSNHSSPYLKRGFENASFFLIGRGGSDRGSATLVRQWAIWDAFELLVICTLLSFLVKSSGESSGELLLGMVRFLPSNSAQGKERKTEQDPEGQSGVGLTGLWSIHKGNCFSETERWKPPRSSSSSFSEGISRRRRGC